MAAQRLARQTPELIMDTLEEILARLSCAIHSARKVCTRSGAHADSAGERDLPGIPATGNQLTMTATVVHRIEAGKLCGEVVGQGRSRLPPAAWCHSPARRCPGVSRPSARDTENDSARTNRRRSLSASPVSGGGLSTVAQRWTESS
jgi:hypothetical protein